MQDWGTLWAVQPQQAAARLTAVPAGADPLLWLIAVTLPEQVGWQFAVPAGQAATELRLPPLCPPHPPASTRWRNALADRLVETAFPKSAEASELAAVKAGLLCWHDRLDDSHAHAQAIEGQGRHRNGDYWHAIVHRREGDYGNAKYWLRRVGSHPIFKQLADQADRMQELAEVGLSGLVTDGRWDPFAFVDACSGVRSDEDSACGRVLRRLQVAEQLLLLTQSCRDAAG